MKRKLYYFMLLLCLFLNGCNSSGEETPTPTSTPPFIQEILPPYELPDSPIREYGESTAFIQMEEDLVVRILYPESGIPALDEAMDTWIKEIVTEYQTECLGCHTLGDCGELTAEYESYILNNHLGSIKIRGIFDKPYLAHPIDIIATFHADLSTGQLITLDDLLLTDGRAALETMVASAAGVDPKYIDEHLLDHWVLTSEGLELTLARGDYLPMSDGTKTLLYSYKDLEGILSFSKVSPSVQLPSHEPATTPSTENVSPTPQSVPLDSDKPMIALTFDDGPSRHTDRLLDIFAEHGGKGTFFVIGNLLENRAEVLKRIVTEGHEVGGHSWDHRQLTKLNATDLNNQLVGTRAKIHQLTGVDAPLLRPPYGSYNSQLKNMCKDLRIVMVNWSLDTLDWKYKNAEKICNTILNEVQDGDIILCHDLYGSTVDAMEIVIPELIAKGYQLVTVSELLDQRGDVIEAGEVYYRGAQ